MLKLPLGVSQVIGVSQIVPTAPHVSILPFSTWSLRGVANHSNCSLAWLQMHLIPLLHSFASILTGSNGVQIRAFASNPHSTSKQELNQSPLAFIETASEPGLDEALKRKDNIIRVRNAQISALWDELHTRQPWKNAIKGEDIVAFPEDAANTTRALAVLGINTVGAAVLWMSHGSWRVQTKKQQRHEFMTEQKHCR